MKPGADFHVLELAQIGMDAKNIAVLVLAVLLWNVLLQMKRRHLFSNALRHHSGVFRLSGLKVRILLHQKL